MRQPVSSSGVLVVDDNESLLAGLVSGLIAAGRHAQGCRGFEEARKYLDEHRPDVLITDVRLGAFNGLHLVLLFKARKPDGRAIVISGFDDPVLRGEAERSGALFLLKPVSVETILRALSAIEANHP
jgi:YesN/AraC family two-component response regulator